MAVRYASSDKASAEYLFGTLNRDPRIHVWPGKGLANLSHIDAVVFTDKVSDSDKRVAKRFIARGGRIVIVADTPEELNAAKTVNGAVVLESYDGVIDAILK